MPGEKGLTVDQRFWAKVRIGKPDECWPWQGARLPARDGRLPYGTFDMGSGRADRQCTTAHRVAWILTSGPIPDGLLVCHHCDNPPCCNPAHLFLGDQSANMQDCVAKDRFNHEGRSVAQLAKTHCPQGHPYDASNTYRRPNGHRVCSECHRLHLGGQPERQRAYIAKPRRRKVQLTREERDQMRTEHQAGATPKELAERWQVGNSTALSIVKGYGGYKNEVTTVDGGLF